MITLIRRAGVALPVLLFFAVGASRGHAQQPPTVGLPAVIPAPARPVPVAPAGPGQAGVPARDTRPTTGNSRIRGRVVVADTMQPARRATVRLSAPEIRSQRTIMTDLEGRYDATNLPPGSYTVSASKSGLVGLSYGQVRPTVPAQVVVLGDKQELTGIDLLLLKGGVISGHVLDDFGDPVAGVALTVMRVTFQQGQQRLVQAQRATSNDIGEYRLFGLQAGSYYIAATPQVTNTPANLDVAPQERSGFAPVFFPGTTDPGAAQKVSVGFGQTVPEINFSLVGVRLAQLSGTAVDSQGRPITSGAINAVRRGRVQGLPSHSGQLRSDGTFVIANVAPGDYVLRANARPQPPAPPPAPGSPRPPAPRPETATARVTVTGDDMAGIHLAPIAPVTVSGRVMFDNPSAAAALKAAAIRVNANPLTTSDDPPGQPNPLPAPPPLKDDFSFDFKLVPGSYILRPNFSREGPSATPPPANVQQAANAAPVWTLKALRVNGLDVTNTGIEVRAGEPLSGVEIEMTNQPPKVSGVVTTANNSSPNGFTVLVFPQEEALWTAPGPGLSAQMRADLSGEFSTQNLRPGRYYVLAVYELESGTANDPEFLRNASLRALPFALGDGETKRLEVRGQPR